MRYLAAWLLFVAVIAYFTAGLGTLWLLRDVIGIDPAQADRIAKYSFVGTTALLALSPLWLLRGKPYTPALDVTHGSARFMTEKGIAALTKGDGLIVGREDRKGGKLIRYGGEAHLLTLAPTRAGKGIGTVIPNLLSYEGSVLCIDPKGENTRVTASRRNELGPVRVLDPFGVSGEMSSAYNPLDMIDAASPDAAEDAAAIADALVADPPEQVAEAHWNEEAKALIAGLILHIAASEPPEHRTPARLRELLTLPPTAFQKLLATMSASSAVHGLVARAANRHLGKADREAAGVLSSAQRHTHFLDSGRIAAVTAYSDFALSELKTRPSTLFLVLPPDRLDTYARWLRLMVTQVLTAMTRAGTASPSPAPVLFLLDEFAALGRHDGIARAMGLMAGYGVQLWPILQNLGQLRSLYGARAGTFLSNAGCVQLFNVNDLETAEWASKLLGETTVWERTRAEMDEAGGALNLDLHGAPEEAPVYGDNSVRRALLNPDEIRRLPGHKALLFLSGQPPILARKIRYFEDPAFRHLAA